MVPCRYSTGIYFTKEMGSRKLAGEDSSSKGSSPQLLQLVVRSEVPPLVSGYFSPVLTVFVSVHLALQ